MFTAATVLAGSFKVRSSLIWRFYEIKTNKNIARTNLYAGLKYENGMATLLSHSSKFYVLDHQYLSSKKYLRETTIFLFS